MTPPRATTAEPHAWKSPLLAALAMAATACLALPADAQTPSDDTQDQVQAPDTENRRLKGTPRRPGRRLNPAERNQAQSGEQDDQKRDKDGNPKLDPALQKRIDEMLRRRAQHPQESDRDAAQRELQRLQEERRQPTSPQPPQDPDKKDDASDETVPLNIPPAEDPEPVPPEERTYTFSIKDGTYDQLVEGFARQTGLGVIGDAPRDGRTTFVTTQELTFREALSRVRMLLFNYKPHDPYWLRYEGSHLRVVRVTDLYRELRPDQMFQGIDALRAANLPDDELALVVYRPKSGSVADLRQVRGFLPDYVRVAPLEAQNGVTIFALVKDIEKYLWLIDFFSGDGTSDPRTLERIEVQYLLPSEAVEKLRQLMSLEPSGRAARSLPVRGRDASPLDNLPEPDITIIPDDTQGFILVRAMRDKIQEMKHLLQYIDVEVPIPDTPPAIITLQHVSPEDMVAAVQQIISASEPDTTGTTPKPRARRRRSRRGSSAQSVTAEGVTLLPHPSQPAIIVIGDDAQIARVRELVTLLDKPSRVGPERIELKYATASEVATGIVSVLGGGKGKPGPTDFTLISDPSESALWFTGTPEDLEKVRNMVAAMDVGGETPSLRIVQLARAKPSFVAKVLSDYDAGTSDSGATTPRGRRRTRTAAAAAGSKFNANDEMQRLFVLCTDSEWETYKGIIDQLDTLGGKGPFVRIDLEHIDSETAVEQIGAMSGTGANPAGPFRFVAIDGAVLIFGASDRQIADIRAFLAEIDKPTPVVQKTFELKYADPNEVKTALETLLGEGSSRRRRARPRRPQQQAAAPVVSGALTIVPMGNRLLVQTTPELMAEVEQFIAEFDVERVTSEIRVYDRFPPGADIEGISDTLSSFMSVGSPGGRRPGRPDTGAVSPQFLAQPASGRLVVIADPAQFPEIENLLDVLRTEVNVDPILAEFIEVQHADAAELVDLVQPLLDLKIQRLVQAGEIEEPGAEGTSMPIKPGARRRVSRRGQDGQRYHMAANLNNTGIIVAATHKIVDEARSLIEQFDQPGPADEEILFLTVPLSNADAAGMVKAVNAMISTAPKRRPRTATRKATPATAGDEPRLTVTEAPGGRAVVLHGPKSEVDQALVWIEELDKVSVRGRSIKVYNIEEADIERLAELILHVIEPPAQSGPRRPTPRRRSPLGQEEEEDAFQVVKTWSEEGIYIQADLIARTMLVATSESRMAEVDDIVARVDSDEPEIPMDREPALPKRIFELQNRDPFDAAWDLDTLLAQVWDEPDQLPKVEAGAFGDILIVRYPYEEAFPRIEELIRKYIDVVPPDKQKIRKNSFAPPPGMKAEDVAAWISINQPDYDVELIDISEKKDRGYKLNRIRPRTTDEVSPPSPCVLPGAFLGAVNAVTVTAAGQNQPEDQPEEEPLEEDLPPIEEEDFPIEEDPRPDQPGGDALLNAAAQRMADEQEPREQARDDEKRSAAAKGLSGAKLKVYYDNDKGVIVVEGPAGVVDEVPDWMSELEEEIEDFPVPPDIRIYRPTYVDVFTAQDIIEEMFGVSRQQRQMIQQQQRLMAQQQRMQQLRQRRQQQQQQQATRGQQQDPTQPGARQQQPEEGQQQQPQMPELPTTQVRIYPNPRDRTLIIRAETSQFPAIEELLATIDQPKPLDSELRIFKLEKLNAADVEVLLTDLLELEEAAGDGGPRRRRQASAEPSGPGAQLPQTIMQQVVTGTGKLGIDPEDIKISSNEEANTIIVLAPQAAVDFIGNLIEQLETEDIPERITETFELAHAAADQVADYLTDYFAEQRRRGGIVQAAKGRRAGGTSDGDLNTPSFIPYPRLNLLTVHATHEQMTEVRELLTRLDVTSGEDQWEFITLQHADAKAVADTLTDMFGGGPGGRAGRTSAAEPSAMQAKFIGAEGERIVFYAAPKNLREQVVSAVERMEAEAADQSALRVIQLKHTEPSKIADAIQSAYERGRGRRGAGAGAQFNVTGHDPSNRLFVMADEARFEEIQSLVETLDQPGDIGFDIRIYTLEYADARKVHATMTSLITNFLRASRGAEIEPFSVEVDERTNSLIVLGSPTVFGFVEDNLKKVDTPANAASPPGTLMVSLTNADAQEVAQNINRLWQQRDRESTEQPPQAEANRSLNMLIVRGTQEQLDEIKKEFIDPLQKQAAPALIGETITLQHADAEGVAESLNRMFEDIKRAYREIGPRGAGASPTEYTVAVTPEPNTNQLIVRASEENLARIKARIAELDKEGVATAATSLKVYPIKNADLNSVVNIINQWARSNEQARRGRTPSPSDVVQATGEPATQSVVVTASESNHMIISELIDGLDVKTAAAAQRQQQVIKLRHANASEVANQLTQVYRAAGRPRSGDPGPSFVADPKTNAVVANVNEEELADVNELVSKLDVELPEVAKRVTEVYPLKYADPGALNAVVLNWFRWDARSQPPPWEQVTSAVEWATQSLVVTASPQNHALIRKLVEKVDVEGTLTKGNFVRKLEHADAEEVARSLQQVYRSRRATRRGEQPVTVTPDPATNALVIVANQVELEEIDSLLESLDVPPDMSRKPRIKTIKLSHADPWSVQEAVNQLFRGARDPRDQVTAVPDAGSRSIVVSAWPEQMTRVEELVAQIDAEDAGVRQVKVINLTNAEADAVARTLNEIFVQSAPRGGRGQEQPITISAVRGAKAVLIKADQVDLAEIEAVVAELDREDALASENVRVVSLLYGDATETQKSLEAVFRKPGGRGNELVGDVRISALPQSNALLVSGGADMLDRIESHVRELDEASESGSVPQVIPLQHAKINQVLPTVQEMFTEQRGRGRRGQEPAVVSGNETLNALIVKASPTDMSGIEAIVKSLDTPEAADKPNFRIVQVAQGINVQDLALKVEQAVNEGAAAQHTGGRGSQVPRITITPDTRTGSLVVAGTPTLFDDAEELIQTMEKMGPSGGRSTRIVRLKNVPADDIQRMIDQLTGGESGGSGSRASTSRSSSRRPRTSPARRNPPRGRRR